MKCVQCHGEIPASKEAFRDGFRCVRCGAVLQVSSQYSGVLLVLAYLLSLVVLWGLRVRLSRLVVVSWPLAFLILTGLGPRRATYRTAKIGWAIRK